MRDEQTNGEQLQALQAWISVVDDSTFLKFLLFVSQYGQLAYEQGYNISLPDAFVKTWSELERMMEERIIGVDLMPLVGNDTIN